MTGILFLLLAAAAGARVLLSSASTWLLDQLMP